MNCVLIGEVQDHGKLGQLSGSALVHQLMGAEFFPADSRDMLELMLDGCFNLCPKSKCSFLHHWFSPHTMSTNSRDTLGFILDICFLNLCQMFTLFHH